MLDINNYSLTIFSFNLVYLIVNGNVKPSTNNLFLLLGTLYCAKGNYEFGISRVIKSLEPYNKKLGTDTWFYAKRCFLSLVENLSKHMISVRDTVVQAEILLEKDCTSQGT